MSAPGEVRLERHANDLDDDGHVAAASVTYDNTTSGLTADEVQAAIDELAGNSGTGGGVMVPYYVPVDTTFTVPLYKQALFADPIEVDGGLIVNGVLIGVD